MKIEFTKEWCLRMAELEAQSASDLDIGAGPLVKQAAAVSEGTAAHAPDPNFAFGRFVRLMRRHKQLSLEKLAEDARVEITELVEIEEDARHTPDPRTVYQLAQQFSVPTPKLMQLAGLSQPKDARLVEEAIRFAARSEPIEELNEAERAALEAFVSVLSERSETR
jgi:HTH-type transcriptional regulator, competence development regulator